MVVCSGYGAFGTTEDWYSEIRVFKTLSGTFPFVDMKIFNQYHAACYSRAILLTRVILFFLCLFGDEKC